MTLAEAIKGFIGRKAVVVGDIMVDEYLAGRVQRISPEGSVPLVRRESELIPDLNSLRLGGAGNAARNLSSLGAEVVLLGAHGRDGGGESLQMLRRWHSQSESEEISHPLKITCNYVEQADLVTTRKLRIVDGTSTQLMRIDTEKEQTLSRVTEDALVARFEEAYESADVIVISDYAKGLVTERLFERIRDIAKHLPIVVDPKELVPGDMFRKYKKADLIIPNASELRNSFDTRDSALSLFGGSVQHAMGNLGIRNMICTLGAEGVVYVDVQTDSYKQITGDPVEVADVTGASDAVTAAASLAYSLADNDLQLVAHIAEQAGRLKVMKPRTGTVVLRDLLYTLVPEEQRLARKKLHVEFNEFVRACDAQRGGTSSRTVCLITGCFDILHRGHLELFARAADEADIVVVAVNSDDYIRRSAHKQGGPFIDEQSRAMLIASMENVDLVTVYDDTYPVRMMEAVRPSKLAMGEEYRVKWLDGALPGQSFIEENKIQVVFVEGSDTKGMSSSEIIRRIRAGAS